MYTEIIYIVCSSTILVLGVYALFENYKSHSNIAYFSMSVFASLWLIFLYLMYYFGDSVELSSLFVRLANGMTLLALYFISYFFYLFPKTTIKIKLVYQYGFSIFIFILFLATIFTSLVQEGVVINNGQIASETYGPLSPIFIAVMIGFVVLLSIFSATKLKTLHGIERTKIKIVSISFFLLATFAIATNVILPQFGIVFLIKESVVFSLFFIIPTLYAIQKNRFFHISYLSLNILRRFIFVTSLLITIIIYDKILIYIVPEVTDIFRTIIVTALTVLTFIRINKYFPPFINKNLRDLINSISTLMRDLYYCNTFDRLMKHLEKTFIEYLNIKEVKLYIVRNKLEKFDIPVYIEDDFTKELSLLSKNMILRSEINYLNIDNERKKIIEDALIKLNAEMCMPLFAEYKLIGFFILGEKISQNEYSQEEINEIIKIKNGLEIALMNLLLKLNLQEENNLMKEIIEQKTEALRNQFREIKSLLEQQSDFIAVTAHEFRTPLSIALFQLEDTLSSHNHSPQVVQDMEVMNESLNNLKELTQKLFDVQQYDLNKIKLRSDDVDIVEFVKQLFSEFNLIMKDKEIKFELINEISSPVKIPIDKSQFRQVVSNLLNNAVKFIDENNPLVQIKLEEDENEVIISILNTGLPIERKDRERIFEKFQTTKVTMGTGIGLGLYICKKIIELHNGKIWVADEKNMTKFSISLRK